tara:strand:- start:418 stop:1341 length:924 start_codon:yes stop_codon:yes gene_type:complete
MKKTGRPIIKEFKDELFTKSLKPPSQKKKREVKTILVSCSGGRTSMMLAKWIKDSPQYKDYNKVYAYCNTGKEREETLIFINKCDKEFNLNIVWIESVINKEKGVGSGFKIVDFETANRNGAIFEEMIQVYGIPNSSFPHCTRELKIIPIHKFMKSLGVGEYLTAIGIRADEQHRVNWEYAKKERYIYPFITDFRVDSLYIRKFWEAQCFDLGLKDYEGNCDMCYKKSNRKLLTMVEESPNLIKWWDNMEELYGDGYTFYRGNKSAKDLIEESKRPFTKAIDLFELHKMTSPMFDNNMDQEESCFCK